MSGGGALIFFGSIKPFTLDCAYKKWGFLMFMRISPGWLRAPLSGFTNFSQSPLVLPRMRMTFLRRVILRLDLISLSVRRA